MSFTRVKVPDLSPERQMKASTAPVTAGQDPDSYGDTNEFEIYPITHHPSPIFLYSLYNHILD